MLPSSLGMLYQTVTAFREQIPRGVYSIVLDQRIANREALGLEESIRHAATHQQVINLAKQRLDHGDFI